MECTPDPWSVFFDHPDHECRDSIAYIRQSSAHKASEPEIAMLFGCKEGPHRHADARLIAAAPDLLDLLIAARQQLPIAAASWNEDDNPQVADFHRKQTIDLIAKVDAVIAKVRGTQS